MSKRPQPAYHGDEPYLFVAYAHEDADRVYPQIRWLQGQGFRVWWDEGISPGAAWRSEVAQAIRGCALLVYFVTPNSVASEHSVREVNFALDEYRRPVLAVHLAETLLPDALALSLSDRQAILEYGLPPQEYERKLISAVATYLEQPLPSVHRSGPSRAARLRSRAMWTISLLLLGGLIGAGSVWLAPSRPDGPRPLARFEVGLPPGVAVVNTTTTPLALSPDGRRIYFSGVSEDQGSSIYVRSVDSLAVAPIEGTEGATSLYLAPDAQSLVFYSGGAFKEVPARGGQPVTIPGMEGVSTGLSWRRDGTIVFSTWRGDPRLMRVSEGEWTQEPITEVEPGKGHAHPYLLPDSSAVLFVEVPEALDEPMIVAQSLDNGERRELIEGWMPRVTSSGHLLFTRNRSIWAAPFDPGRLTLTGPAVPVLKEVFVTALLAPVFSVADDGSMAYLADAAAAEDTLVWSDLAGNQTALPLAPGRYAQPRISPDGSRALIRVDDPPHTGQLWVYEFGRNSFTKLHDGPTVTALWSADGRKIIYSLLGNDGVTLVRRNADGTGAEEVLVDNPRDQFAWSRSPGGDEILYTDCTRMVLGCDIGRVRLTTPPVTELILATEFNESIPTLSRDGRWLAYESDRSGRSEVYVQPYPDIDSGRWQISTGGGKQPLWSPDGGTLYYAAGAATGREMLAVDISVEDGFRAGKPRRLFDFLPTSLPDLPGHDLHPDGDRFLLVKPGGGEHAPRLIYVQNWLDEVEQLVPTD